MRRQHKYFLRLAVIFGLVLALHPQPARADIFSFIAEAFSNLFNGVQNLANDVRNNTTAAAQDAKLLAKTQGDAAQYISQNNRQTAQQSTTTNDAQYYKPHSDYACAMATDVDVAAAQPVLVRDVSQVMDQFFNDLCRDTNAGTAIDESKALLISCNLGLAGTRYGSSANCAAPDPTFANGDLSIAIAILDNFCIPFDAQAIIAEIPKLAQKGYRPPANIKAALIAVWSIVQNINSCPASFPKDESVASLDGVATAARMTDKINRLYAGNYGLEQALAYNACPSQTFAPGCDQAQTGLKQYLQQKQPKMAASVPSGYCLSPALVDYAMTARDQIRMETASTGGARDIETEILFANLDHNIKQRQTYAKDVYEAAVAAAQARSPDIQINGTPSRRVQ